MAGLRPVFLLWHSIFRQVPSGLGLGWNLTGGAASVTVETGAEYANDWSMASRSRVTLNPAAADLVYEIEILPGNVGAIEGFNARRASSYVIGGHNMASAGVDTVELVYKAAAGDPWDVYPGSTVTVTDDDDVVWAAPDLATNDTARNHWGIRFHTASPPMGQLEVAIVTAGTRQAGFHAVGTLPTLDPWGFEVQADTGALEWGSPLGVNPRTSRRRLSFQYGPDPGFPRTGFWDGCAPNTVGMPVYLFRDEHLVRGLPFWVAWNLTDFPRDVVLCRADRIGLPFDPSASRYGLELEADGLDRR